MSYSGSVGRQTIGSMGSSEDSTTGSIRKQTFSERHPKAVKSVTVIGYLISVSFAAILLSAYYVIFYKPKGGDVKEPGSRNSSTWGCRGVNTFPPTHEGQQAQLYHRYYYNPSKRSHSRFVVPYRNVVRKNSLVATAHPSNEVLNNTIGEVGTSDYYYDNSRTTWQVEGGTEYGDRKLNQQRISSIAPTNPSFPISDSILLHKLMQQRNEEKNQERRIRNHTSHGRHNK